MALELVAGGSLQARLDREGPLEPTAAVTLLLAVADALAAAHAQGLLHRDLKPANVLQDERGAPKLTDFGIAKELDSRSEALTATGAAVGTPSFAPPEQCGSDQPIDARADVYGLGATLYALLTGRPPFVGTFAEVVGQLLRRDPEPPSAHRPGVPEALDRVVLRCLEKEPAARYPTALALRHELERFLRGEPLQVQPPTLAQRWRRWRRRRPALLLVLLAVALATPLGAAFVVAYRSQPVVVDATDAVEVAWAEPLDGFETHAGAAELAVDVKGAFDWLELSTQVGDQPRGAPRRIRAEERVTLVVPLAAGDNAVTLRVRSSSGVERVIATRRLRSNPFPAWYGELKVRPPLPLPDGVSFGKARGVYVNEEDGSELVWVPPGTFTFGKRLEGLVDTSKWVEDSPRETTISRGFFLGRTEVTWARWDAYCRAKGLPLVGREINVRVTVSSGHEFESKHVPISPPFVAGDEHPVFRVSWDEAQAYCAWAGLRLPTEAEWEWAAVGPEARGRPWGDEPPAPGDCNCLVEGDGYTHTAPVMSFPRDCSWVGCFDLAANVSEWVQDGWGPIAPQPATDPRVQAAGSDRVARGAPWYYPPTVVAGTYRFPSARTSSGHQTGFRVAR